MSFDSFLDLPLYGLAKSEKEKKITDRMNELTRFHRDRCRAYADILSAFSFDASSDHKAEQLPFLPVRMFKEQSLCSVKPEEIVKTMTSSGTTGQAVSKIFLDKTTATNQQKALVRIVSDFTGSARMPMIIVDSPSVIKDRRMFSARGAGILGFSIFGSKRIFALDEEMHLDAEAVRTFLDENSGKRILIFGFTFMIWEHFYKELLHLKTEGISFDLSNCIMIHGGGWKKLINEAVKPEDFKKHFSDVCGLSEIHDYYGMVEQTGCIYMECEYGHLHASVFSDVMIRRPQDFSICNVGERGVIQVLSVIPESYPGHSLLTEDEGVLMGEDDCPCGRKGKHFKILGRIRNAEIRGCSDTYATDYAG